MFQTKLQDLMAEYNLGIKSTKGLFGEELEETICNNDGMEQLYLEITKLHLEFLAEQMGNIGMKGNSKEAKPKRARAPAKKKAKPTKLEVVSSPSSDSDEEKPAKKPLVPAKINCEKVPKAPSSYSMFTSHITKMNKGSRVGGDITVAVTWDNVTAATKTLLADENAKTLMDMKRQVKSVAQILEACQKLLNDVEGKVHAFKLSSLMWAAVGNKNPF
jgi:hypothetical protein